MLQEAYIVTKLCGKRTGESYKLRREETGAKMKRRGVFFVAAALFLVLLAYVVPYAVLSGVDAWYGSFLFWAAFGLAAILLNAAITSSWRD